MTATPKFLQGGGEMGRLIRCHDWSRSAIGSPTKWHSNLQSIVGILLHSRFPMFLFWGDELLCFYNDAYRPSLGNDGKHPSALGKPGKEIWPEIWHIIGPQIQQVLFSGEATWHQDQLVPIYRNGKIEDVYWTYSYSPVYGTGEEAEGVFVTCMETTRQVLSRKVIEESRAELRRIFRQAPTPIQLLRGSDFIFEICNEHALELLGKTEQEVIGKKYGDVYSEANDLGLIELLQHVYSSGELYVSEETPVYFLRDGNRIDWWAKFIFAPLRNEEGHVYGIMIMGEDITPQVIARKKIEESENAFKIMANSIPEIVWVADSNGNTDFFNKRWEEFCGIPYEQSTATEVAGRFLHPEDAPKVMAAFKHAINTATPLEVEQRNLSATGEYRWFLTRAMPYRDPNTRKIQKWFGISVDIHDRKMAEEAIRKSESQFRDFSNNIQNLAWMASNTGDIYWYNQRWYDYTGTSFEQMRNDGWEAVIHPDHIAQVSGFIQESWKLSEPFELTFPLRDKHDTFKWFLMRAVPIKDDFGQTRRWIGTNTNINERVELSERLEDLVAERTQELHRSNEDLQQFAHVASHDLKEPVRKIKTFVSLLTDNLKTHQSANASKYLSKINSAVDRMFAMIDGVLTYSSFTDKATERSQIVDLNLIISSIETDLELVIQKKDATIEKNCLPVISGSEVLLYQLFYNLLNNALKFTRSGTKPVIKVMAKEIKAYSIDEEHEMFEIEIVDNGIGFKQSYAEEIFRTFIRLNPKDHFEGTGLGLALCKKIVNRFEGWMKAEGTEGEGARFTIGLPRKLLRK